MRQALIPSEQVPVIHVVDDDGDFRKSISRLLKALGYEVRSYQNAGDYLLAEKVERPGCLLLDFCMPGPNGLELQNALAESGNPIPMIFLSGRADISIAVEAMKNGAEDFLSKPVDQQKLIDAINNAIARYNVNRKNHEELSSLQLRYETLTVREKSIFKLVASGKLNKEIAFELNLSERTVKAHRAKVMDKLQVHSLAELVRIAVQIGNTNQSSIPIRN